MDFCISTPEWSYIIGLLQTDGSHYETSRNRGKITLELNKKDEDIILLLKDLIPCSTINTRIRDTNFKKKSETVIWSLFNFDFRYKLKPFVPVGVKSSIISKPNEVIEKDYWRGIIDGDGSLGITKNNIPFISLVTKSDSLAYAYISFLKDKFGIIKTTSKNKRDGVYNIMVSNENSKKIVEFLYSGSKISIKRKFDLHINILNWIRPVERQKVTWNKKKWSIHDDDYIISHTIEDSIEYLNRTEKSIKTRLFRLKKL